eukprot:UN34369
MYLTLPLIAENKQQIIFTIVPQRLNVPVCRKVQFVHKDLCWRKNVSECDILRALLPNTEYPERKYFLLTFDNNTGYSRVRDPTIAINRRTLYLHEKPPNNGDGPIVEVQFKNNRSQKLDPFPRFLKFSRCLTKQELYNIISRYLGCILDEQSLKEWQNSPDIMKKIPDSIRLSFDPK